MYLETCILFVTIALPATIDFATSVGLYEAIGDVPRFSLCNCRFTTFFVFGLFHYLYIIQLSEIPKLYF